MQSTYKKAIDWLLYVYDMNEWCDLIGLELCPECMRRNMIGQKGPQTS